MPASAISVEEVVLHGQRMEYRRSGTTGPHVILLHGMAGSAATWNTVMPRLGRTCQVIAPDLLGHGKSAKPVAGDYSLGSYASGVRDLMVCLGIDRATVVGHSLGGGVALQFAYQFPERCERLVLVSSGGLGTEVHAVLRLATLPGFAYILQALSTHHLVTLGNGLGRVLQRIGLRPGTDAEQAWRSFASFSDPATRAAFIKTIRSVIAAGGQRVSALDRLYLAAAVPMLLVWGDRDGIIPVEHARAAHELIPDSRLEIVPNAGHYPHRDDPAGFTDALLEFMSSTPCADVSADRWREMLLQAGRPQEPATAAQPDSRQSIAASP